MDSILRGDETDAFSSESSNTSAFKQLYEKYEPLDILGRGMSSVVRRGRARSDGSLCAIKTIDLTTENNSQEEVETLRKDAEREIRMLELCGGQENIMQIYFYIVTDTYIFIVTELCKNGELFDYMMTDSVSLSEKKTRHIMRQLLSALRHIHSKDVVHRDIKPENILLDDAMQIKLADFGLAEYVGGSSGLTEMAGTVVYMAPEMFKYSMYPGSPPYGKPIDLWACGVVMYTLLSGSSPFWHARQLITIRMIMEGRYSFDGPQWSEVSDLAKDLVFKFLMVNPDDRITVEEALDHAWLTHTDIIAVPSPKFSARRMFRKAIIAVYFSVHINYMYRNPSPLTLDSLANSPYGVKIVRKLIDGCAFQIYGHWVQKGDLQNRAALFQPTANTKILLPMTMTPA